jgi:hypothetical protein
VAFLNRSLRSVCFIDKLSLVKKKSSSHGTTLHKCQIMRISKVSDQLLSMEYCCAYFYLCSE